MSRLVLVVLAGCSQVLGIEQLRGGEGEAPADASVDAALDAAPDAPSGMRVISGKVLSVTGAAGPQPAPNVPVQFVRLSDDAVLASTTSGADGAYQLAISAGVPGVLISSGGFAAPDLRDTVVAIPSDRDVVIDIGRFTTNMIAQLASICGAPQDATRGVAIFEVRALDRAPAAGVSIQSLEPGIAVRYDGPNGYPVPMSNSTGPTGRGWQFNLSDRLHTVQGTRGVPATETFGPISFGVRRQSDGNLAVTMVVLDQRP
jgi:hypothetical protein